MMMTVWIGKLAVFDIFVCNRKPRINRQHIQSTVGSLSAPLPSTVSRPESSTRSWFERTCDAQRHFRVEDGREGKSHGERPHPLGFLPQRRPRAPLRERQWWWHGVPFPFQDVRSTLQASSFAVASVP